MAECVSRSEIRTTNIGTGITSFNDDNIIVGQIPRRMVISMVSNASFGGTYKKNPFNFQTFAIGSFSLKVNGVTVPQSELTMAWDSEPQRGNFKWKEANRPSI